MAMPSFLLGTQVRKLLPFLVALFRCLYYSSSCDPFTGITVTVTVVAHSRDDAPLLQQPCAWEGCALAAAGWGAAAHPQQEQGGA